LTLPDSRLPTGLWVEAEVRRLNGSLIPCYVVKRGNYDSGLVILKSNGLKGAVRLYAQERDFMTDTLVWRPVPEDAPMDEPVADTYITRAISRDPDVWVIEVEEGAMGNVFMV